MHLYRKDTAIYRGYLERNSHPMPNFLQRAKALGMQRNKGDIDALLAGVFNAEAFSQSRSLLEEMRAPAARRRSMLRDPDKCLSAILERWHAPSP